VWILDKLQVVAQRAGEMGFVQHEQHARGIQLKRLAGPIDQGEGVVTSEGSNGRSPLLRSTATDTREVAMVVRRHLAVGRRAPTWPFPVPALIASCLSARALPKARPGRNHQCA
jgi:hypothetical protein